MPQAELRHIQCPVSTDMALMHLRMRQIRRRIRTHRREINHIIPSLVFGAQNNDSVHSIGVTIGNHDFLETFGL